MQTSPHGSFLINDKVIMIAPGDETHSLRPLNWLLESKIRVVFLNGVNPFPDGREGFEFFPFPYPRGRYFFPRYLSKPIGSHLFRVFASTTPPRLRWLWRKVRPTVVHVHWVDERAYYCAKAGIRPLVLTVWGSDINKHFLPDADPVFRDKISQALAAADVILVDSTDMHQKCSELVGRSLPTMLMPQGVRTDQFRPGYTRAALEMRHKLAVPPDAIVLLSIRGWSPIYRHEKILEAFAKSLSRLSAQAVLIFKILKRKGIDHLALEKDIRELAKRLGVEQQIRWMDEVPIELLPGVYSFADAIINYPSMDAFPVTFLEAAACQCPVISCRLPAYGGTFAEQYFNLVSPNDLDELADAMVEFVNNHRASARENLAELRALVCRDYDEQRISRQLLQIYKDLSMRSYSWPPRQSHV